MKANFAVVKLDQTDMWHLANEDMVKAGRIYGLYVTDLERRVHCCEFTPSYELHFIMSVFQGNSENTNEDNDHVDDELRDGDRETETVQYMHCHQIENFPKDGDKSKLVPFGNEELPDETVDWDSALEGYREYAQGNCGCW